MNKNIFIYLIHTSFRKCFGKIIKAEVDRENKYKAILCHLFHQSFYRKHAQLISNSLTFPLGSSALYTLPNMPNPIRLS